MSSLHFIDSPIRTLRVGLTQALGRTKRCKGMAASSWLWHHRFGGLLVRGVGYFISARGVACSGVRPALREFRSRTTAAPHFFLLRDRLGAGTVAVVLQAQAMATSLSSATAAA